MVSTQGYQMLRPDALDDRLLVPGFWGGRHNSLLRIRDLLLQHSAPPYASLDEALFLERVLWRRLRSQLLMQDPYYCLKGVLRQPWVLRDDFSRKTDTATCLAEAQRFGLA